MEHALILGCYSHPPRSEDSDAAEDRTTWPNGASRLLRDQFERCCVHETNSRGALGHAAKLSAQPPQQRFATTPVGLGRHNW